MTRDQILKEIKSSCETEYAQIDNWIHDIHHIKRVVKNGRQLCRLEKIRSKDMFLVEVSCWLHDLGRVGEEIGLRPGTSHHAEVSYQMSKKLLKPYERYLGRESVYRILQAVREHSLPILRHSENLIARLVQDADRGASLNVIGIFTMLTYLKIVDMSAVTTIEQARLMLPNLTDAISAQQKIPEALQALSYFKDWYYGTNNQDGVHKVVSPLHTKSARKLYKKGIKEIEKYMKRLEELSVSHKHNEIVLNQL